MGAINGSSKGQKPLGSQAETAVAFETKAVEIQRARVRKLREDGQYSGPAEEALKTLETSLDMLKHDRDAALEQMDRSEAGSVSKP